MTPDADSRKQSKQRRGLSKMAAVALLTLVFPSLNQAHPQIHHQDQGHSLWSNVCRHKFPITSDQPHTVKLDPVEDEEDQEGDEGNRVKRQIRKKHMKIKVLFHESVEDLSRTNRRIIKQRVVPEAVQHWENVFQVVNGGKVVRLNRKCENNQYFLSPGDNTQYCKNKCVETKCGEWVVPEHHLEACSTCDSSGRNCNSERNRGKGLSDVDFVLYVSALNTEQCIESIAGQAETVAYAAHCQQEDELDRPIAGHTNICPQSIKKPERDIRSLISTLKHELLHALGFSSSLFAFYRDKNGRPLTKRGEDGKPPINRELQVRQWSDKIIKEVRRDWKVRKGTMKKNVHLVVTPAVVREVRRHFNCPTLDGAELEDQGGDGTALTHWEKRLFQNEAMTGTVHTDDPIYSRITLAMLEDSGWYIPDYSKAQDLSWGRGAGCAFATKSCKELMEIAEDADESTPFCNTLMGNAERTYCTADSKSVGSCNLVKYTSRVPDIYQNFDSLEEVKSRDIEYVGSSVVLADFCPYVQEFSWLGGGGAGGGEDPRGTRCDSRDNAPDDDSNYALESYGQNSRCFGQASQWEQKSCTMLKQWTRYGSGCYKYKCTDGRLNIILRNVSFPCYERGQRILVELLKESSDGLWIHNGKMVCPDCNAFCSDCSQQGRALKDHDEQRENLGDCVAKASEEEPNNPLVGFFNQFNFF